MGLPIQASAFNIGLSAVYLVNKRSPSFVQLQTWLAKLLGALSRKGLGSTSGPSLMSHGSLAQSLSPPVSKVTHALSELTAGAAPVLIPAVLASEVLMGLLSCSRQHSSPLRPSKQCSCPFSVPSSTSDWPSIGW